MRAVLPFCALVLLLGALSPPPRAEATSIEPMTLPQLAERSTRIVHGRVVGQSSRWNEDRSMIVTDVRVRVLEDLRGGRPGEIVVTQPGGTVGKIQVEVEGAAAFRDGDEVVLFLAPDPAGRLFLNGLDRGRYAVVEDPARGGRVVRGLTVEAFEQLRDGGAAVEAADVAAGSMPLDRFLGGMKSMIRDLPAKEGN